ncbi:hypothetical protein [Actinomadura sp. 21ATH]|uniref:hypothetical protein n=1 Tax=Actinomadura sp. 21ATH TaxID=1735444 RepID=UPI0035BF2955
MTPVSTRELAARSAEEAVREAREAAERAPSLRGTRPWTFGALGRGIGLYAAADPLLEAADPDGREMLIGCGAALFTLRVAIRALGYEPRIDLLPDPDRPYLLAGVRAGGPAAGDERARRLYRAVRHRRTHGGAFRPGGIDPALRRELRAEAEHEGVRLVQAAAPAGGLLVLIITPGDETLDWLRAGQAMQRMLLRAAEDGLAAAFHPGALEPPGRRESIRARFCDEWYPQVLLRLGAPDGGRTVRPGRM